VRLWRRTAHWPFFAVRHAIRRTAQGMVHRAPRPTFAVCQATWRTAKGAVHRAPGPIVVVRHVARHTTKGRVNLAPWPLFVMRLATWRTAKSTIVPVRAKRRTAERVWRRLPADGRQHLFFAVRHLLRTTTNCVVRCLFPKAHDKVLYRVKMSRAPYVVRFGKIRTAKAVPCVLVPLPCAVAKSAIPVVSEAPSLPLVFTLCPPREVAKRIPCETGKRTPVFTV
jgi:hypothetical protein